MKEDKREEWEKNETDLLHLTRDTLTKEDIKKKKKNRKKHASFHWQRPVSLLPG